MKEEQIVKLKESLDRFEKNDFKVKLDPVLESDMRKYYIENGFNYLRERIYQQ